MDTLEEDRSRLREILNGFDNATEALSEAAIYDAIRTLRRESPDFWAEMPADLKAESMAFAFSERNREEQMDWGTFYGYMFRGTDSDGNPIDWPSIEEITPEILQHWEQRAKSVKHPILRSRYAGLVWEFSPTILKRRADISYAHIFIDDVLEIARKDLLDFEVEAITKLEQALSLAISINDRNRIEAARDAIIEYESKIGTDEHSGTWGFAFDCLVANKKSLLRQDQEQRIIADLEARLMRLSGDSEKSAFNPNASENAGLKLAEYYRKAGRMEDVKRVLRLYGQAQILVSENVGGLAASSFLQKVFEIYYANGMREETEAISQRLRASGKQSMEEMQTIISKFSISEETMTGFIVEMTEGPLEDTLPRIAGQFIPDPDEIEKQIRTMSKKSPLQFLFTQVIQDGEGRPIARIGPIDEDLDGHIVAQTANDMKFSFPFLHGTLERLIAKDGTRSDWILNHLYESPIMDSGRRTLMETGVGAYLNADHRVAAHLLVPQIEHAIRRLLTVVGGVPYRPNRSGGLNLRTMDDILRDVGVVKSLTERITHYLRVALTDARGWNLRNNICHGLQAPDTFGPMMTDRLIHILLVLAQVREGPLNRDEWERGDVER